jgi:4-amino-4-deoxy-L-arabinose transferase-like glycosyltransferase
VRAPRWFLIGLGIIVVVAGVVRVAYTLAVSADFPTVGDAETYHLLAENLAEGSGYVRPREDQPVPTAEFPPLFPGVLAVASLLGADSLTTQKLVTSMLGVVSVGLIGLLCRRVGGPAVGLTAAALAAVYPMLFQLDGALMAESLYLPLITATLLATYWAIDGRTPFRWAVAGLLAGLAALTRAEALLLVPLLFVPEAVRHAALDWRQRSLAVGAATLAVLVVVSPWLVRNWLTFDRFVPISNNSGTLIAGANCPRVYHGDFRGLWLLSCVEAVETEGGNEAERFARYREAGLDYARENLGDVPTVAGIRVLRTFGLHDVNGQLRWERLEGRDETWQKAGHRFFLVIAPLAVVGVLLAVRRRWIVWPLVAPVVLVIFTALISYGNQRFRIAAEPGLLVLASVTIVGGMTALRPSLTTLFAIPERRVPEPRQQKVPEIS